MIPLDDAGILQRTTLLLFRRKSIVLGFGVRGYDGAAASQPWLFLILLFNKDHAVLPIPKWSEKRDVRYRRGSVFSLFTGDHQIIIGERVFAISVNTKNEE